MKWVYVLNLKEQIQLELFSGTVMSFLTNQFGPMSGVCTKVFLKKVFLLEVLSYSLQLFWTKLSYFSDTSTDREIKDSTEELQFPHLVGGKETTLTWLRNERLQACKEWPYRSLFIRSGIIRKVLLHSCLESSCAQAAPEHNWLCCCHSNSVAVVTVT